MKSWIPWRYFVRHAARRHGFLDPVGLLARLRRFAQPSEVQEPIELIRAGVAFHARGLINTKVLQNNLDWIWPYWVERQFDPDDPSFLPRAFSFSHVNLTHRNWTAVGLPDAAVFPVVDPRGLVTPLLDGWSLDWWYIPDRGEPLHPSRADRAQQRLEFDAGLAVVTTIDGNSAWLESRAGVEPGADDKALPRLHLRARVMGNTGGRLVLAIRPVNPEGVRFVDAVRLGHEHMDVNGEATVRFDRAPGAWFASNYASGDLSGRWHAPRAAGEEITCPAGLVSAGAGFSVRSGEPFEVGVTMELREPGRHHRLRDWMARASVPAARVARPSARLVWEKALADVPVFEVPEAHWQALYQAAVRTLLLLSPDEVYPGPFTYRRFWFRDACLILRALLALNLDARAGRAIALFPRRQKSDGYFHSQEGEWDANGEVLWIANEYERATGRLLDVSLWRSFVQGARWIGRKRAAPRGGRHTGLLPPGFSAEHLGPNDYYYWDDFWGIAGLRAAAAMSGRRKSSETAAEFGREATAFLEDVQRSLAAVPPDVSRHGIPASPNRRMDAGAIGSLVADYPLQLPGLDATALRSTAAWLWENCRHGGGFFQDMIHSGVNAYLTLALAQTFLRAGDPRHAGLIQAVADLASPTGQWPEAVHPRTGGGCMGDGQHAWASAEWVMMMRALFVREEPTHLVIGAGLPAAWLQRAESLVFGPTATAWGPVTVRLQRRSGAWRLTVRGQWRDDAPELVVAVPGFQPERLLPPHGGCVLVARH